MLDTKYPKLDNPPIAEALVGIRFSPSLEDDEAARIAAKIKKHYGESEPEEIYQVRAKLQFDGEASEPTVAQEKSFAGFAIKTPQKEVTLGKDRITLRDMEDYDTGDSLIAQFQVLWSAIEEEKDIVSLERVGLRIINNFEMTNDDLDSKLKAKAVLYSPEDDALAIRSSVAKYSIKSETLDVYANVAMSIEAKDEKDLVNVVFDIDVFDTGLDYVDFKTINATFKRLRAFKNALFYGNIPDAKERFDGR